MRKYREFSQRNKASVRTAINPTALTVATSTLAGVAIEAPAAANDGVVGRWRVDTTNALYTDATDYRVAWTATIAGNTFTRTLRFRHVTPALGATPGAPSVGLSGSTPTTATFTNVLGTGATTTLITLVPANGGPAISGTGSGAYITIVGLSPNTTYYWSAQGVSSTGAQSAITAGNLGTLRTAPPAVIGKPLLVKLFVNNEGVQHPNGPWPLDVEHLTGVLPLGSDYGVMAQGQNARIRYECNHGAWWKLVNYTVRWQEPDMAPFGVGDRSRAR